MDGELNTQEDDGVRSGVTDSSVFLDERHCGEVSALLEPIVSAWSNLTDISSRMDVRSACGATGSGQCSDSEGNESPLASHCSSIAASLSSTLLPLHIAAIHGVSFEILHGLCSAYPEGAHIQIKSPLHTDRPNILPIELFEEGMHNCFHVSNSIFSAHFEFVSLVNFEGRAGHEVSGACNSSFPSLMAEYFRRSDLLFSYFPEAVSSKNTLYCRDEARLRRFEELIRAEAHDPNPDSLFSDMAGSVWLFMCRSGGSGKQENHGGNGKRIRHPNFAAVIGRILDGLGSRSIQKLSHVRTVSNPEGVRIHSLACTGRSILEEARERAPKRNMKGMLNESFFFTSMLCFLSARDALSFSSTCWKARASGVRILPEVSANELDTMDSIWSSDFPRLLLPGTGKRQNEERKVLKPWQKLDIPCVPSCTHTVLISYDVHFNNWDKGKKMKGGGLFVVREDRGKVTMPVCTSLALDTLEYVVASVQDNDLSDTGTLRLSISHNRGHSYALWVYGYEGQTTTITNLRVQQLVYSCDSNGLNPIHALMNEGEHHHNLREQISMLVSVGFGSSNPKNAVGELPIHYALKVGAPEK